MSSPRNMKSLKQPLIDEDTAMPLESFHTAPNSRDPSRESVKRPGLSAQGSTVSFQEQVEMNTFLNSSKDTSTTIGWKSPRDLASSPRDNSPRNVFQHGRSSSVGEKLFQSIARISEYAWQSPFRLRNSSLKVHNTLESLDYSDWRSDSMVNMAEGVLEMGSRIDVRIAGWVVTFLIGIFMGLIAVLVVSGVIQFQKLKFDAVWDLVYEGDVMGAYFTLLGFVVLYTGIATCLVVLVEPMAAGSGIPEIKTLLNGVALQRVVRFKTLVCKVVGVCFSVSAGLPVGKEGPMIHSGAIVGAGVSQGKSKICGLEVKKLRFEAFRNDKDKCDFIACGASSGIAAAFSAPIGGTLFALEEGATHWNNDLTFRTFFSAIITTWVLNFFLSGLDGSGVANDKRGCNDNKVGFGLLGGSKGTFNFGTFNNTSYYAPEMIIFIFMGAGGGLLGAVFNFANEHLTKWRMKHILKWKWRRMAEVIVVAVAINTIFFWLSFQGTCLSGAKYSAPNTTQPEQCHLKNELKPSVYPVKTYLHGGYHGSMCTGHQAAVTNDTAVYNDLASLYLVPGEVAIQQVL